MNLLPLTSLPRSGSTLLLYTLKQNPKFCIGADSEIGNILNHNKVFIQDNIFHFQLPHEKVENCFKQFCRSGVLSWINEITDEQKIFIDKSRYWLKDLDFIFNIFPEIKILITIRDLRGIINSFEKINNNSLFAKNIFRERMDIDMQLNRVNSTLNFYYIKEGLFSLKEIADIPKKYADKIKICRYEDLISQPEKELNNIYNFLDIEYFIHDFNNISQDNFYDNPYQPYGCHKIKGSITSDFTEASFSELKPEIEQYIVNEYYWYYKNFYPEIVI